MTPLEQFIDHPIQCVLSVIALAIALWFLYVTVKDLWRQL